VKSLLTVYATHCGEKNKHAGQDDSVDYNHANEPYFLKLLVARNNNVTPRSDSTSLPA
jgi:hypothetical protein